MDLCLKEDRVMGYAGVSEDLHVEGDADALTELHCYGWSRRTLNCGNLQQQRTQDASLLYGPSNSSFVPRSPLLCPSKLTRS